jgi:CRISPR-associated endonuclease Csn1
MAKKNEETVLGLDLGTGSVGWGLIEFDGEDPRRVIDAGVRIFDAGLDSLESDGRGKSRNLERREARQIRRGLERRGRRMRNLARLLQRSGLLPQGNVTDSIDRHDSLKEFDAIHDDPYCLRARAVNERLELHELGRALYHLAQRRGFLSNRKSAPKKEEDASQVKAAIKELQSEVDDENAATLGHLFHLRLLRGERVRGQYTGRQMYLDEFDRIWASQVRFHSDVLTASLRKHVHHAIFYQRPLKSQARFIGKCELEKGRRRAPMALLICQRYRYLQSLNNLRIVDIATGELVEMDQSQRNAVIDALEYGGDLTFGKLRSTLGFKRTTKFNLERDGEKRLIGNRTSQKLAAIFGEDRWRGMTDCQREEVVEDWYSIVKEETLKRRGMRHWGLGEEAAQQLAHLSLESDYSAYSRQALARIVPLLERGVPLQTAIKELYPEHFERTGMPLTLLPEVNCEQLPDLRNPVVTRTLSEMRRVVNAVINRYGQPDVIRIELARELRQSSKQRQETTKRMKANQRQREAAAQAILKEAKIPNPSRRDIEKYLLAEECNWTCPYTGNPIAMDSLFGAQPRFDIEHIIPFSRSLDNSFVNKTISDVNENRRVKGSRTPHEAYAGATNWPQILKRVKQFQGRLASAKLRLFMMDKKQLEGYIAEFSNRHLNDTRWAARSAKRYLGLLYGGVDDDGIDGSRRRRVQAVSGPVTAYMRQAYGLNTVLSTGDTKSRDDHRHHAIDALVVALTGAGVTKKLSDAAKRAELDSGRLFKDMPPPWPSFRADVEAVISSMVPSHRISRRVRGALHKDTFYGAPRVDQDGNTFVTVRKALQDLTPPEADRILDPTIRNLVVTDLDRLGLPPNRAFVDENNLPVIVSHDGSRTRVRRVRIRARLTAPVNVDSTHAPRYVNLGNNHHMAMYETTDDDGSTKWEAEVVSLYEAYRRRRSGEPVVNRASSEKRLFLFSLSGGEIIELTRDGILDLFVVRTVAQSTQIRFVPIRDARTLNDIGKKNLTALPETLRRWKCRKMVVTPLGEVRTDNT